jgi:predicted transcriptional regulator
VNYGSRTNIVAAIRAAVNVSIKVKKMYKAFLSFLQLKGMRGVLEETGLLKYEPMEHQFNTTGTGRQFLKM